jgi:N-acyl-D-amino-acid deacylase
VSVALIVAAVAALAQGAGAGAARPAADGAYDLVIRGGRVIDGSGNPWIAADVGVRGGRVAAVGRLEEARASATIDARGRVVAPGFIDVHTHLEDKLESRPTADNFVADGVTTAVTGNCGASKTDLAAWAATLRRAGGVSLNVASLVGHNSVRRAVMGMAMREPTADEARRMEALVEAAMRAGAVGLSTGLIYTPGTYAKTAEIAALARVAGRGGGVYVSHIRNEGDAVLLAIDEALSIGREAGLPVHISHFKIANKRLWGGSAETLARVESARRDGLDVTIDQYPYAASSTSLQVLLPAWALEGGADKLKERLADAALRKKIAAEMKDTIRRRNGRERLDYVVVAQCTWDRTLEGKSVAQINRERRRRPRLEDEIQTVLDVVAGGPASAVYHSMDERDVERILRHPHTMVASDGGVQEPDVGVPHPRSYGTNARVLARFVRDKNLLRLEEAVRRMTSLPAQRFGLHDRGLLRPGHSADIVVFDEHAVADRATFEKPHAYAEGFSHVLVAGEVVWQEGRHTGRRPGKILFGATE